MRQRYANLDASHRPPGARAVLRWGIWDRLTGRRRIAPPGPPATRVEPDRRWLRDGGPPRLTWIGHSSFLGTIDGTSFLIDPVFTPHAGWLYRRHLGPGLTPGELPPLGAVMVTHNHYDHLDGPFLRRLAPDVPVLVPAGLGPWLRRRRHGPVSELGWWQSVEVGGLSVTFVPSRHWSRRWIADTNRSLWGGFVVAGKNGVFYHAGDSGWFAGFAEIGRRFPGILAAMLPIGAYAPPWFMEPNHMNPEQAGQAFLDVGARYFIPMHWGSFQLTDEPLCEPLERLERWWSERTVDESRRLKVLAVGETAVFDPTPT